MSKIEIAYSNFNVALPSIRDIVLGWINFANKLEDDYFKKLILLWVGFNGWATCVTEIDRDSQMIDALCRSPKLNARFGRIYSQNEIFKRNVDSLHAHFPIFDGRSFRRKLDKKGKILPGNIDEHIALGLSEDMKISHAPQGWIKDTLPSWQSTLRGIYKVRCNLFHGQKDLMHAGDQLVVELSFKVLSHFIRDSEITSWECTEKL